MGGRLGRRTSGGQDPQGRAACLARRKGGGRGATARGLDLAISISSKPRPLHPRTSCIPAPPAPPHLLHPPYQVKIWSNLRHPAVCSFMGTCVQRGLPAIVLEYLPGSLHDLLHKPTSGKHKLRPLSERVQVQIGREIATGVAYLHSEQLIHRDIKAANVLLDEHLHVKLADFGISTGFGPEHTAETGTYRYMAPEVIRHQQYDHKCDVYSYGVLLWEVLHRQVPFRTHSPLQAAYAVAMERERPPVALKSSLAPFASVRYIAPHPHALRFRHGSLYSTPSEPPSPRFVSHLSTPAACRLRQPATLRACELSPRTAGLTPAAPVSPLSISPGDPCLLG